MQQRSKRLSHTTHVELAFSTVKVAPGSLPPLFSSGGKISFEDTFLKGPTSSCRTSCYRTGRHPAKGFLSPCLPGAFFFIQSYGFFPVSLAEFCSLPVKPGFGPLCEQEGAVK